MRKQITILFLFLLCTVAAYAQDRDGLHYLGSIISENDTLPHVELKSIPVHPRRQFKSKRMEQRYWRLARRVKKVLPYAREAARLMAEYDQKYRYSDDKKLRKKYLKEAEDELFALYGPQLRKLSISEGRILIKLIDRETKNTSYALIKDLKGGVSAFFWQGIAKLFGNDLKDDYDPIEEDRDIEEIIFFIDSGII